MKGNLMEKQKIFSQKAVKELFEVFRADDSVYLSTVPFAVGYEELESPDINKVENLPERADPNSDCETAIALFEAFPNLNALEASSSGFWTHLTHVELWNYMRKRFPLDNLSPDVRRDRIKKKWFLGEPSQSALIHHPLAGLWWGVKLTVAPERGIAGQYDLTRILYRNLDVPTRTLGTYELGRLPAAIKGILGYVYDHPEEFKNEYEAKMRAIMRLLNSIGGVLQLGCLDEAFFQEQIAANRDLWINEKKTAKAEKDEEGSDDDEA